MTELSLNAQIVLNATKGAKFDDELAADILRATADMMHCAKDEKLLHAIADELVAE
jgi:hypothetical protein